MAENSNVNGMAWWLGWNPSTAIIGGLIGGVIIGFFVDQIPILLIIGLVGGIGSWYWGVSEVNNKYTTLRDNFFAESRSRAENKLGFSPDEVSESYNLRVGSGSSPPFIEPPERYKANHLFLSDVSVSVDRGSIFDVEKRNETSTGTTTEIYYDNIETISSNDRGGYTDLVIQTSAGDDLSVSSGDQQVVESAQSELRNRMRDVRRQEQ